MINHSNLLWIVHSLLTSDTNPYMLTFVFALPVCMRSLPYFVQRIMKCSSCVLIWKEACRKEEKKASDENF